MQEKTNKQEINRYSPKEIIAIVLVWLFALALVYIVYLKIKMLHA
jgi:hypothetical protein